MYICISYRYCTYINYNTSSSIKIDALASLNSMKPLPSSMTSLFPYITSLILSSMSSVILNSCRISPMTSLFPNNILNTLYHVLSDTQLMPDITHNIAVILIKNISGQSLHSTVWECTSNPQISASVG